jgi:hypothetical protein
MDSMMPGKSTAGTVALLALASAASFSGAPPAAAEAPFSPADYRVGALCSAPAPGHSACLGLNLIAKAPRSLPGARAQAARSRGAGAPSRQNVPAGEYTPQPRPGTTPAGLRGAYGLSAAPAPASPQTIAIVDAYDDPKAEADLEQFSRQFGLPACTKENSCFSKVNQEGKSSPLPAWKGTSTEQGWALEIATDIETAHAVCPSCRILLVEAKSNSNADLYPAENAAVKLGAKEISNSWGSPEEPPEDEAAFNHPRVVITASAGDSGYLNWLESRNSPDYPASSPHVVAVGGTRLHQSSGRWEGETVWNDGGEERPSFGASGGGCSGVFPAQLWQQQASTWSSIGCTGRAVADVSADGDPYTGVDVYDSTPFDPAGDTGWTVVGGTSVASPIIAAVFALAGGAHGVEYPARTLYENAAAAPGAWLHDVSSGSNGRCTRPFNRYTGTSGCTTSEEAASCSSRGICLAGAGYDGPSGVGTPKGIGAFQLPTESKEAVREEGGGGSAPGANQSGPAAPEAGSGVVSTREASPQPTPAPPAPVKVSGLTLTRKAAPARSRRRPRVARVGFAFTLSAPARITVTLASWRRSRRGGRWRLVAVPVTFDGNAGRQRRNLNARRALAAGRYSLTVTPAFGVPASLVFRVP